jgi:hypothetical protein
MNLWNSLRPAWMKSVLAIPRDRRASSRHATNLARLPRGCTRKRLSLNGTQKIRNAAELKILEAIREGTFDRIEITLDNGKVRTLHKIDHPDISMSIDAFVKEHPYQSLNIAVRQGGVASLERRDAERLD